MVYLRQLLTFCRCEHRPLRGEVNDMGLSLSHTPDRLDDRIWLHHHAGTAPKRAIIDLLVPILREIADICMPDFNQPFISGPASAC